MLLSAQQVDPKGDEARTELAIPPRKIAWGEVTVTKKTGSVTVGTPPKTNMEPNNGGLEDDFPFQTGDFQVPC